MCVAVAALGLTGMQTATLALGLASTAFSAVGAYQHQKAANRQADYNAQIARNNALAAEYEAQYAKESAAEKAKEQKRKTAGIIGSQRAAMGASGVVADEGTFLNLTLDSAEQGKLDELAILHEGDKEAWRAEINADNYTAQSQMYSMSKSSPFMTAAPILMSGAAKTGLNYYSMVK